MPAVIATVWAEVIATMADYCNSLGRDCNSLGRGDCMGADSDDSSLADYGDAPDEAHAPGSASAVQVSDPARVPLEQFENSTMDVDIPPTDHVNAADGLSAAGSQLGTAGDGSGFVAADVAAGDLPDDSPLADFGDAPDEANALGSASAVQISDPVQVPLRQGGSDARAQDVQDDERDERARGGACPLPFLEGPCGRCFYPGGGAVDAHGGSRGVKAYPERAEVPLRHSLTLCTRLQTRGNEAHRLQPLAELPAASTPPADYGDAPDEADAPGSASAVQVSDPVQVPLRQGGSDAREQDVQDDE